MNRRRVVLPAIGLKRVLAVATAAVCSSGVLLARTAGPVSAQVSPVASPSDSGVYEIVNRCSGRALDVSGFSTSNGAQVWVWDRTGRPNQRWKVFGTGTFVLRPTHAPSKALDVPGAQDISGLALWQYDANGTNAQRWSAQPVGDGSVRLISAVGGKALQVRNGGAYNASVVEIAPPADTCAQKWTLEPVDTPAPVTTVPVTTLTVTTVPATSGMFYVSPAGNDGSPGTSAQPFATPQRAIDAAQTGNSVVIRTGTYNLTSPVVIANKRRLKVTAEGSVLLRDNAKPAYLYGHGTVRVENSDNVEISGLRLEASPYFGFRISDSRNVSIVQNATAQTQASAIFASNSPGVKIVGNDVSRFCDGGSFVRDESNSELGCQEGISVSGPTTNGFEISSNVVHDAPMAGKNNPAQGPGGGEGIDVKEGANNGVIRNNRVFNLVQLGIYVDGYSLGVTNVEVSANVVHDNASGIVIAAEAGGAVSNVKVFDNIAYRNGLDGISISKTMADAPRTNIEIYNNTLYQNGVGASKPAWAGGASNEYGFGFHNDSTRSSGVVVRDNIAFANVTAEIGLDTPQAKAGTALVGNFTSDPQFVDAQNGNFALRPGSAAVGKGARL
jgi:Ricin-type beta-trefoil lectin domain-like/Right handed beta helix region